MIRFYSQFRNLLFLSIVFSVGLRLIFLHVTFFSVDEAVSAVAGNTILEGGLPYRDAIDHRGPLTYYAYALIFQIFGKGNMTGVHFLYAWLIGFQTLLVWDIGRKIYTEAAGNWAALCFAIFAWSNPFHEMWAAHTEWLLILFSLLGVNVWLGWEVREEGAENSGKGKWRLFVAGVLLGICLLSKQVGVLDMMAVTGFAILVRGIILRRWRQVLLETMFLLLGWVIPLLLTFGYFFSCNALEDFIFYVWEYNTLFYLPELTWASRLEAWGKLFAAFFWNKFLLAGLLVAGFVLLWQKGKEIRDSHKERTSWIMFFPYIWLLATLAEAMAGGRAFQHYLIPALPAMSLIGGAMIDRWRARIREGTASPKVFAMVMILGLSFPLISTFIQHREIISSDESITEFEEVSSWIEIHITEKEQIFVWGFAPEIYLLSHRKPATRYSFCNVLTGHLPAANEEKPVTDYAIVPGVWDTLMSELDRNCPAYIVDTQPGAYRAYEKYPIDKYPLLQELVQSEYHYDSVFHQQHPEVVFHLYQRNELCPDE